MNSHPTVLVCHLQLSESLSLAQDPDPRPHSDPTGFDRVSIHRDCLTLPFLTPSSQWPFPATALSDSGQSEYLKLLYPKLQAAAP